MSNREQQVVTQTEHWLKSVVIEFGFCPFAKREVDAGRVHYAVVNGQGIANSLHALIEECERLDHNADIETTLVIFPDAFQRFDDYLDLLAVADQLLTDQNYEGVYQLASFHPDYVFEGEEEEAASNFTNRSPYPMLHILREASLEQALTHYSGDPSEIPERNIEQANKIGAASMRQLLEACFNA